MQQAAKHGLGSGQTKGVICVHSSGEVDLLFPLVEEYYGIPYQNGSISLLLTWRMVYTARSFFFSFSFGDWF
jgi:hypothetical protein